MKERDLRIDLIKLIAITMVVILHTIEPASDQILQSSLYLVGVFGIPLFFMVNGYLLYEKDYTRVYFKKNVIKYSRFLLSWIIVIGALVSIKDKHFAFIEVLCKLLVGSGWLFHLWFVITLLIIHLAYFSVSEVMCQHSKNIKNIVSFKVLVVLIIIMNVIFIYDIFYLMPERSLVKIIPITYRPIRYIGYFFLGLYLRKLKNEKVNIFTPPPPKKPDFGYF